jgi:deoxycytidine triphosphate deaminase
MKHIAGVNSKTQISHLGEKDIQPNAVDLKLDKVFKICDDVFILSENEKQHRSTLEIPPLEYANSSEWFKLNPGTYQIQLMNTIQVGEHEAGWVITRSTLIRNGVFLSTGLYDSGYHGPMICTMHVTCGEFQIQRGTRIGQYLNFDSEMLNLYNGSYGFKSK